jgi:HSP20 family protein
MTGLIRFSPLTSRAYGATPIDLFNGDFNRAFDALASQFFVGENTGDSTLRADVSETDSAYVLRFDVPGVAKENISVTVEDKTVKVDVNYVATLVEGEKALRTERATGSASRTFRLPVSVNSDAATASHELGVLTLTLPKTSAAQQKRIAIN